MKRSCINLSSLKIYFSWAHNHWQVPRQSLLGALCRGLKIFHSNCLPIVEGTAPLGVLVASWDAGTAHALLLVQCLPTIEGTSPLGVLVASWDAGTARALLLVQCRALLLSFLLFSCSVVSDSVTPWTEAHQAPLSSTVSSSLFKLTSFESVVLSNRLVLCCSLLLLPSIFPSL